MEYEIYIPQPQADALLAEAADLSISVEELLAEIIQNYMERNDDIPLIIAYPPTPIKKRRKNKFSS